MRKIRKNDWLRLQHMSDAAKQARLFVDGSSRRVLDEDLQLQFALTRAIEIVCEAACNVTDESQSEYPQIAWQQIMGMRQWLVHAYIKIDLDILWKTTVEDLPPLISQLDEILSSQDARL